jgi:hypothetical protein
MLLQKLARREHHKGLSGGHPQSSLPLQWLISKNGREEWLSYSIQFGVGMVKLNLDFGDLDGGKN